jgi:hypothetical protein
VRSQLDDAPPAAPPTTAPAALSSTAPLPAAPARGTPDLGELAGLLADSDSRAIDWWQLHELALADVLEPVTLRALSRAIARFDFDAALALCERARRPAPGEQPAQPGPGTRTETPASTAGIESSHP